jgi:hypothetical protein
VVVERVDANLDRVSRSSTTATLRRLDHLEQHLADVEHHLRFPVRDPKRTIDASVDALARTYRQLMPSHEQSSVAFRAGKHPESDRHFQDALETARLVSP